MAMNMFFFCENPTKLSLKAELQFLKLDCKSIKLFSLTFIEKENTFSK